MANVNVELLLKTLEAIEASPHQWSQQDWRCASTLCFAGWACELAGGVWAVSDLLMAKFEFEPTTTATTRLLYARRGYLKADALDPSWDREGDRVHARKRAMRLLNITAGQAEELFSLDQDQDLAGLRREVEALIGGAA